MNKTQFNNICMCTNVSTKDFLIIIKSNVEFTIDDSMWDLIMKFKNAYCYWQFNDNFQNIIAF